MSHQPMRGFTRRTGGIHAVELLLILPIVLALVLGMAEFSQILTVEHQLAAASMQGARVAAQGGSEAEVEEAARLLLGAGTLNANAVVTSQLGEVSGDPVIVTVRVDDASALVADWLRLAGITIRNKPLVRSTVLRRE